MGEGAPDNEVDLSIHLAHERAEVARLRAEIASVSSALESGKDKLESLLLDSDWSSQPGFRLDGADDSAFVRSLELQIQATRDGSDRLSQREAELLSEHTELSSRLPTSKSAYLEPIEPVDVRNSEAKSARAVDSLRKAALASTAAAGDMAGTRSHGTFPSTGWREHALSNISLVQEESSAGPEAVLASGVVVDRVFEGVVSFTSGHSRVAGMSHRGGMEAHGSVVDVGIEVSMCRGDLGCPISSTLAPVLLPEYSKLSISLVAPVQSVEIVAVTPAIEALRELLDVHSFALSGNSTRNEQALPPTKSALPELEVPARSLTGGPSKQGKKQEAEEVSQARGTPFPRISHASKVLTMKQFGQLVSNVPKLYQDSDLQRLYCSDTDGFSLATLLRRSTNSSPTLLVIRDTKGHVFGCYAPVPWKEESARSYGSGECWVFRGTVEGDTEVFRWSRRNKFFQLSSREHISIGGGGSFALWIDEDLLYGSSGQCPTFENPPLSSGEHLLLDERGELANVQVQFEIVVIEVWKLSQPGHLAS